MREHRHHAPRQAGPIRLGGLLLLLVLMLVLMGPLAANTHAQANQSSPSNQTNQSQPRYTFVLVGVPLEQALERVLAETQLSLVYESNRVAGRTSYCRAEGVTAEALLACILRDTGLDYARLSSGTYILIKNPERAPQYSTLAGQVVDAVTGLPLSDASVMLSDAGIGTATNRDGRFAFAQVVPGPHRLIVSHIAYHPRADTLAVEASEHTRLSLGLEPRIVRSSPVVIRGYQKHRPSESLGQGSPAPASPVAIAGVGTPDLVQSLDRVPGVRLGAGIADVHVQGGDAGEQMLLLDGVRVFMPVSNGGVVGLFSPFAAGKVTVRKAGFEAAHGSALSGVIDVEQSLSNPEGAGLVFQIDPMAVNARWTATWGHPAGRSVQWMVAARQGLWGLYEPEGVAKLFRRWATADPVLFGLLGSADGTPLPSGDAGQALRPDGALEVGLRDLHASARVNFGGLRSLRFSLYHGIGSFGLDDAPVTPTGEEDRFEDAYHWNNTTAQLRYEWIAGRRKFLHLVGWTTGYSLYHPVSLGGVGLEESVEDFNEIAEGGARFGGDWAVAARHTLTGAVELVHTGSDFALAFDPLGTEQAGPEQVRPVRWRGTAFLEDRMAIGQRTVLTVGSRLTYLPGQQSVYAEPRLALTHDRDVGARGALSGRVAMGLYRQYLHAFDVATYNVASLLPHVRFWLPIGKRQRPPEAYHFTTALGYRPVPGWSLGLEAYLKHQPHLLVLDYGQAANAPAAVIEAPFRSAEGFAYGTSLHVGWQASRVSVDGQYDFAIARRRIDNRFDGRFVPVPWDAPHRLALALDLNVGQRWAASVRWMGLLGRSWGFRRGYYDFLEPAADTRRIAGFDLADPAAHQPGLFSQWDVAVAYSRSVGGVRLQARLGVLNVLGRANVIDWSLRYDDADGTYRRVSRLATDLLPTASLRVQL